MHFDKTGQHMKGKPPPVKVTDVEGVACPKGHPNHVIINLTNGTHRCKFCGVSWSRLDAGIREAAGEAAEEKFAAGSRRRGRPVEEIDPL